MQSCIFFPKYSWNSQSHGYGPLKNTKCTGKNPSQIWVIRLADHTHASVAWNCCMIMLKHINLSWHTNSWNSWTWCFRTSSLQPLPVILCLLVFPMAEWCLYQSHCYLRSVVYYTWVFTIFSTVQHSDYKKCVKTNLTCFERLK